MAAFSDTDASTVTVEQIRGREVVVWSAPTAFTLTWMQDGYMMQLSCSGSLADYSPEQLIAAVQVMDTEVADG